MMYLFGNNPATREGEGAGGGPAPAPAPAPAAAPAPLLSAAPAPAPAQAPPPSQAPATLPTGEPAPWYSSLPEDLRTNATLHGIRGVEDLARAYVGVHGLLGKDPSRLVELPADDAGQRALFQKLGLPEKPEDYKLADVPEVGEHGKATGDAAKWLAQTAHEIGILPSQAQALFEKYAGQVHAAEQAVLAKQAETANANVAALQAELGQAFDQEVAAANVAARKFGLVEALNDAGVGTNPAVIKALAALGKTLAEGGEGGPGKGSSGGKLSPDAARAKANSLMEQAVAAKDPLERQRLHAEASRFYKMAHGEI